MPFFDNPGTSPMVRWRDSSLDSKLFFVWQGAMMVLTIAAWNGLASRITFRTEAWAVAGFALCLIAVAVGYRAKMAWRWPGMAPVDIPKTTLVVVGMAIFVFVFFQPFKTVDGKSLPIILFVAGIVAFNILGATNVLQRSSAKFLACCQTTTVTIEQRQPLTPIDPAWKRALRGAYFVWCIPVWLEGMAFFYVMRDICEQARRARL